MRRVKIHFGCEVKGYEMIELSNGWWVCPHCNFLLEPWNKKAKGVFTTIKSEVRGEERSREYKNKE